MCSLQFDSTHPREIDAKWLVNIHDLPTTNLPAGQHQTLQQIDGKRD